MGSDLAMEADYYARHPRPNKAVWEKDELVISKYHWYENKYLEIWRGELNATNIDLVGLLLGDKIPEKPARVILNDLTFCKEDLLEGIYDTCENLEADQEVAVRVAVDSTLQYVREWLEGRGSSVAGNVLESIAELS